MKTNDQKETVDLAYESIHRLSCDDYKALQIVSKIRAAIRHEMDISLIAATIKHEFDLHLDAHFIEEETWLFPKVPHTDVLRIDAQRQHDHIKYLAWQCANEEHIPDTLPEEFANALEEHIRFEERTLFPYIKSTIQPVTVRHPHKAPSVLF